MRIPAALKPRRHGAPIRRVPTAGAIEVGVTRVIPVTPEGAKAYAARKASAAREALRHAPDHFHVERVVAGRVVQQTVLKTLAEAESWRLRYLCEQNSKVDIVPIYAENRADLPLAQVRVRACHHGTREVWVGRKARLRRLACTGQRAR